MTNARRIRVVWKWLETGDRTIKDRFVDIISCSAALAVTADSSYAYVNLSSDGPKLREAPATFAAYTVRRKL
jgi:hypothetical protein